MDHRKAAACAAIRRLDENGATYFKAKEIAEKTSLTVKQVGTILPELEEEQLVERWSTNSPRTWRIIGR